MSVTKARVHRLAPHVEVKQIIQFQHWHNWNLQDEHTLAGWFFLHCRSFFPKKSGLCYMASLCRWAPPSLLLFEMLREAFPWDFALCILAVCLACLSALVADCLEKLWQGMWTKLPTGAALEWLQGKSGSALRASLGLLPRQQGVQLCLQPLQLHRIYIEASRGLRGLACGSWVLLLVGASVRTCKQQLFAGAGCSWNSFSFLFFFFSVCCVCTRTGARDAVFLLPVSMILVWGICLVKSFVFC